MRINEVIRPDQQLQSIVLYHGTSTKAGYKGIAAQGLKVDPELVAQKYKGEENFAPLPGVYLSKEFGNAVRYSFMSNVPNEQYAEYIKQEPYGYVFEFSGKDLTSVTADEDELGNFLKKLVNSTNLPPNLLKIVQAVPDDLKTKLQQAEMDFETNAVAGKWVVDNISDATMQYLMKRYSNVVNYGGIKPKAVWVIPKPSERFLRDRQGTFNTHNGYTNYARRFGKRLEPNQSVKITEINNKEDFLSQDPWTFDQTPQGWRSLPLDKAAQVLKKYISTHVDIKTQKYKNMTFEKLQPTTLLWHLGQILAIQGYTNEAIRWMVSSREKTDQDWNDYVDATIAFLRKDLAAFDKIDIANNNNAKVLQKLRNDWDKPYKDAYG